MYGCHLIFERWLKMEVLEDEFAFAGTADTDSEELNQRCLY